MERIQKYSPEAYEALPMECVTVFLRELVTNLYAISLSPFNYACMGACDDFDVPCQQLSQFDHVCSYLQLCGLRWYAYLMSAYRARIFLGLAEGGLFPGVTFYISLWQVHFFAGDLDLTIRKTSVCLLSWDDPGTPDASRQGASPYFSRPQQSLEPLVRGMLFVSSCIHLTQISANVGGISGGILAYARYFYIP